MMKKLNSCKLERISFLFSDGSQTTIDADKFREIYEKIESKEVFEQTTTTPLVNSYSSDADYPYEYQQTSRKHDDYNYGC